MPWLLFCSDYVFFLFGGCFGSCSMFFFSVPVKEEPDCVLDVLDDVLSVSLLLLLSLVSCLLFLDLVFDFFADFFFSSNLILTLSLFCSVSPF